MKNRSTILKRIGVLLSIIFCFNHSMSQSKKDVCEIYKIIYDYYILQDTILGKDSYIDYEIRFVTTPNFVILPESDFKFPYEYVPKELIDNFKQEYPDSFNIDSCDICECTYAHYEDYYIKIHKPPYRFYFNFYYPYFLGEGYAIVEGNLIRSVNFFIAVFKKTDGHWVLIETRRFII